MNKELLKITLVLVSMPIWLPFAKALWEEFRDAMRAEGGFSGPTLSARQRREIEAQIEREGKRLVDEPLAVHRAKRNARFRSPAGPSTSGAARAGARAATKKDSGAFRA